MAFSQIATSVTIINSGLIGYSGISLTNLTSTAASLIASGSGIEIAGAFFKADADVTPNASSWTAITTATTAYLALTPSGTAGSQVLSAEWASDAPTWSTSKQGWYASAASTSRVILSAYKSGPTSYDYKEYAYFNTHINQAKSVVNHGISSFTSSGFWYCYPGVSTAYITGCAAGATGATGSVSARGNGGNGGSWIFKAPYTVNPGTLYSVSIGAPGSTTVVSGASTLLTLTNATVLGGTNSSPARCGFQPGGAIGLDNGSLGGGYGGGGSLGAGGAGIPANMYLVSAASSFSPGYGGGGGGGAMIATGGTSYGGFPGSAIIVIEY